MSGPRLLVVRVIQQVVQNTSKKLYSGDATAIDFQPGRPTQIQTELQKLSQGTQPGTRKRYPLVALFYDFGQDKGEGYPITVSIPKLSIACLTVNTDPVLARYDKTIEPILYPIYEEFLRQLARHPNIVGNDPNGFRHKLWERPGSLPEGTMNDYLDALELQNLQLTFKKVQSCKSLNS